MRRALLLRLPLLATTIALALPAGTIGQALMTGLPAVDAGVSCDTTLTLTPGGSSPNVLPDGLRGVAYDNETLTVTNGPGPHYYWELVNGTLPPDMFASTTDSDDTVSIYGTPTAAGKYSFTVAVRDWLSYPNWPLNCAIGAMETYQVTVQGSG